MPKGKKYSFPILKNSEIVKCMRELKIDVQSSDLKNPSEERYRIIYGQILQELMAIDLNQGQIKFQHLDIFEYPQLHEKSVGIVSLVFNLIKFMQRVGVKDFNISDLIKPEPNRTIRNLSAIINFAKFRHEKLRLYQDHKSEEQSLWDAFKQEQMLNTQLAQQFGDKQTKREEEAPEVEAVQAEIDTIQKEFHDITEDMNKLKGEIHASKKDIKLQTAQLTEHKTELHNLMDSIHTLEKQIVQSPQKLKKRMSRLHKEVAEKRRENATFKEENKFLEQKKLLCTQFEKSLQSLVKLMETSYNYRSEAQNNLDNKQATDRKTSHLEQQLKTANKELEFSRNELESCKRQLSEARSDYEKQKKMSEDALHDLHKKRDKEKKSGNENVSRGEELEQHILQQTQKDENLGMEHNSKMSAFQNELNELHKCVITYHSVMKENMVQM